jgi:PEP-CTERM motif
MNIRPVCLLASALVCLVTSAQASPITYDFSGTLAQPYNGSSLFSGSFSFESSTAGFGGGNLVAGYAGASASLTIGGQTYQFRNNTSGDTGTGQAASQDVQIPNVWYQFVHDKSAADSFNLIASNGVKVDSVQSPVAMMSIHLNDLTGTALSPSGLTLPSLDLKDFSTRQLTFSPSPDAPAILGTITNLQAVPEPSTLAFVFLVGLGLVMRRKPPWLKARGQDANLPR